VVVPEQTLTLCGEAWVCDGISLEKVPSKCGVKLSWRELELYS
jgi:hypothetical protein